MRHWMWWTAALVIAGTGCVVWATRLGVSKPESTVGKALAWAHRVALPDRHGPGGENPVVPGGEGAEMQEERMVGAKRMPDRPAPSERKPSAQESDPLVETIVVAAPEPAPPRLEPSGPLLARAPLAFETGGGEAQVIAGPADGIADVPEETAVFPAEALAGLPAEEEKEPVPTSGEWQQKLATAAFDSLWAVAMPPWFRPLSKLVVIRAVRVETGKSVTIGIGAHAPYLPPMAPKKKPEGAEESEIGIEVRTQVPGPPLREVPRNEPAAPETDPHDRSCPHCPYFGGNPGTYRHRFLERIPEKIPQE